jgi:hypothetical protein
VELAASIGLGVPLLFAAVWVRMAVTDRLKECDDLLAERERLQHALLLLEGEKAHLSTWASVGPRARRIGLRPPESAEVLWVAVAPPRVGRGEG